MKHFPPDAHVFSKIHAEMHIGLQGKCQVPCLIVTKTGVAWQIFIVFSNTKFKGNPFGSYQVVRCLQIVRKFDKCSTKTYMFLLNAHVYSACSVI